MMTINTAEILNAEHVVLVDEHNKELGIMGKLEAHEKGLLHRAFSVFVFNHDGKLLLQQRALSKYHSGGLWTNTCCSHPKANEAVLAAAHRRLQEEMGFDCELEEKFHFIYKAGFENGLTEHELDFVFVGTYNQEPHFNTDEVKQVKWLTLTEVEEQLKQHPEQFTAWFKIVFDEYVHHLTA